MKKLSPKYSIVIPTLNEEKYLPKLLSDLAKQNYKGYEVIVCDGVSSDNTVEKARGYGKEMILNVITCKKRNVAYQRNLGAKKAKGEWIIFIDADSRLPKTFLEKIDKQTLKNNVDIFTTWSKNESRESGDKAISTYLNLGMELLKLGNFPAALGALIGIRKRVFENVKGFSLDFPYGEDAELVRRTVKNGYEFKIYRQPQFVYSLRRVRKLGRMQYLRKTTFLNLKSILNLKIDQEKEYPMGGFIEEIKTQDIFDKLKLTTKNIEKSDFYKKLSNFIKSIKED